MGRACSTNGGEGDVGRKGKRKENTRNLRLRWVNNTVTCFSDFRRGFGSVSRLIGCSPGRTTISCNTFNLTISTPHKLKTSLLTSYYF
jgi:hypothetical protein